MRPGPHIRTWFRELRQGSIFTKFKNLNSTFATITHKGNRLPGFSKIGGSEVRASTVVCTTVAFHHLFCARGTREGHRGSIPYSSFPVYHSSSSICQPAALSGCHPRRPRASVQGSRILAIPTRPNPADCRPPSARRGELKHNFASTPPTRASFR